MRGKAKDAVVSFVGLMLCLVGVSWLIALMLTEAELNTDDFEIVFVVALLGTGFVYQSLRRYWGLKKELEEYRRKEILENLEELNKRNRGDLDNKADG